MSKRTDDEVLAVLKDRNSRLNKARMVLSGCCAHIEQGMEQAQPLSPIAVRRLELEAIERIVRIMNGEGE